MSHANGQIPDSALVTIAKGARLLAGPAAAFEWICDEVERRYGWRPQPTGSFDGYRPLEGNYFAQTETFERRYRRQDVGVGPLGDRRFWPGHGWYVRWTGAAAAVPGTSNHGWGCAVDVANLGGFGTVRYLQFAEVAAEVGWTNTEGRSIGEHWHWVDVGNAHLVKNGLTTGGVVPDVAGITTPTPIVPRSWFDMATEADLARVIDARLNAIIPGLLKSVRATYLFEARTAGAKTPSGWYVVDEGQGTKRPIGQGQLDRLRAQGLGELAGQPGSRLDDHRTI